MSEAQLALVPIEAVAEVELVDGDVVEGIAEASVAVAVLSPPPPPTRPALEERNLFAEAQRIGRPGRGGSTRRQYGAIFRSFGDGSPPSSAERRRAAIWTRT